MGFLFRWSIPMISEDGPKDLTFSGDAKRLKKFLHTRNLLDSSQDSRLTASNDEEFYSVSHSLYELCGVDIIRVHE